MYEKINDYFSARGTVEQLIKESHCVEMLKKYLEFRNYILIQNEKDLNNISELFLNTKGERVSPGIIYIFKVLFLNLI